MKPVQAKFKDDQRCPCPTAWREPASQKAWEAIRGKPVLLGRVVPTAQIVPRARCGSDTYWEVLSTELVAATYEIMEEDAYPGHDYAVTCRHMLDIGD